MTPFTRRQRMPRLVRRNATAIVKRAATRSNHEMPGSVPAPRDLEVVEKLTLLFEPDRLAQAQFFSNYRRKTHIEPERKLTLAILEDAINCFQDNVLESGRRKKLFDDAEKWFLAEKSDWIFSFRNICELLSIDPDYLREGLMRWKKRQLAHYSSSTLQGTKMAV